MSQTAKILIENAIPAQIQLHGVDSETARQSLLARFLRLHAGVSVSQQAIGADHGRNLQRDCIFRAGDQASKKRS